MTEQAMMPRKSCKACGIEKDLVAYNGRRNVCRECEEARRQRSIEKREATIQYSPELAEKITSRIEGGETLAEICQGAAWPTRALLARWRRANPEFDAACGQAEQQSAAAHIDKAKEVLRKVEDGKLPVADARLLFDGHVKLAATLSPTRYGSNAAAIDPASVGRPLVSLAAAIQALIDALPTNAGALPAPIPIDVEATEVPEGTVH